MNPRKKNTGTESLLPSAGEHKPAATEETITLTLSPQVSALVRWYCATTKHREGVAVDGALYGALERAKESYEQDSFDEGFNAVVEDVLEGMNSSRLRGGPARHTLTVALDEQASGAVRHYSHHTGSDLRDVVNAAVTAEVPGVLEQLAQGIGDDAPGILSDYVAAAARRRTGQEPSDAPAELTPLPHEEGHGAIARSNEAMRRRVSVELSDSGLAALDLILAHDGHADRQEAIRAALVCIAEGLFANLGRGDEKLHALFSPDGDAEEAGDEAGAA